MELRNAKEDENEKTLEASVIGNDEDAGKDGDLVVVAEAVETSGEDEKFVDEKPPEEAASVLASIEENKTEDGNVEGASVLASVEASSSGMIKPKKKVVKKVKKIVKKRVVKGTALPVAGGENVTVEQIADPSSLGASGKETKKAVESAADSPQCSSVKEKDSEPSLGEDDMEEFAEAPAGNLPEAIEGSGKKQARKVKAKAKLSSGEGGQQMTVVEQNKQNQLAEDKTGLVEGTRRKRRRQGKQVLGSDKKQKKEVVVVAAVDVTQRRREEGKEEMDGNVAKTAGLIFMCNAKTRPDCFRFSVMGVQEKRKDYVMSIKPGMKLFLYDYDLKLLYGVFQASSAGGMKLERNAFGGSFSAQVRFTVVKDCLPLPESEFKKAIKENYNNKNKFKTELSRKQVFKLTKLFRPASLPAQLTHTLPVPVPKNHRYDAPGSSSSRAHTHERSRNHARAASPPPRREEPPQDLFLSEREYRTYGLRRAEPIQHYPDSSYSRDRLPLDHEMLLRRAEMERQQHDHDRREVRLVRLPERDYHHHHHQYEPSLASSSVAMDAYRRDPYYRYEYRSSPERPPRTTYLANSSGREEDDLYSRYVTADSLAEYYRSSSSSRRFPSMAEPELFPPSSVTSRYGGYSGSLPYSHR
ncbi:unnamed protein product [Microthlaspi erraticum]|uniref:DCD domain-containing protein n=1 Tax=Microthlaspi erraticum TaxID=1685480 RepID=A0A6D2JAQ8_9BRAS|nr:unnamed protein product [Microthlaspi erraticum]